MSFAGSWTRSDDCITASANSAVNLPRTMFCDAIFDDRLCWPPTLIGQTIKMECPDSLSSGSGKYAYRKCDLTGTWSGEHPWKRDDGKGWTNYSECVVHTALEMAGKSLRNATDGFANKTNLEGHFNSTEASRIVSGIFQTSCVTHNLQVLQITLLFLSLLSVITAICVVSCSKSNQQPTKVTFYVQLFAAFAFLDVIQLFDQMMAHFPEIARLLGKQTGCRLLVSSRDFLDMATYWWLMMLALYFYSVLKGSRVNIRLCIVLSFLGWGIPALITITLVGISVLMNHKSCQCDDTCTSTEKITQTWVKETANIIALVFSYLFFSAAVYFRYKGDDAERRKSTFLGKGLLHAVCFDGVMTLIYIMILFQKNTDQQLKSNIEHAKTVDGPFACFLLSVVFLRGMIAAVCLCVLEKIKCRACAPRKSAYQENLAVYW